MACERMSCEFSWLCIYTGIVMVCMPGVRRSSSRCEPAAETVSTPSSSRTLPALITESDHIGDDWLVEDVRGSKRKRPDMDNLFKDVNIRNEKKRNRPQTVFSGRMPEPPRGRDLELQTAADNRDRLAAEEIFDSESASPESSVMLNDGMLADRREFPALGSPALRKKQSRLSSSGSVVPAVARQVPVVKRKAESSSPNVTSTTVVEPPPTPKPNPLKMRLKVRISDQLILVPVLERFIFSLRTFNSEFVNCC